MQTSIEWSETALRLFRSAIASAAVGVNPGEEDRPVGLRTTIFVAPAAAISMVQVNLLSPVVRKATDSFAVIDLMRSPVGILFGTGFIGAGAIMRGDQVVRGVNHRRDIVATTMGQCFYPDER